MNSSKLIKAGINLTQLALGCEPLGGTDCGQIDFKELHAVVEHAWDLGIRVFDTADVYGLGHSEKQLSKALGGKRHEAVIVSKFGLRWNNCVAGQRAKVYKDASPVYMKQALEASLRRMAIEAIPLYLLHWPDVNTPLEQTLEALELCKEQGKILAYGLSNFNWSQCEAVLDKYSLAAIECKYSLLDQEPGNVDLANARNAGVETLIYGALAQGLLSGKYNENTIFGFDDRRHRLQQFSAKFWPRNKKLLRALHNAAEAHGKSLAQVAIRWILDQDVVSSLIVGAKNPTQLEANMGALNWRLDPVWTSLLTQVATGNNP